jgi:hypothetical protein
MSLFDRADHLGYSMVGQSQRSGVIAAATAHGLAVLKLMAWPP